MCSYHKVNCLQICKHISKPFDRYIGILLQYQGTRNSWSNCHVQLPVRNQTMKEILSSGTQRFTQNEETFFCEKLTDFAWKNYLGQLAAGNCLGAIIWRVIIHETIIQTPIAWEPIFLGAIAKWTIILGENCLGGNFPKTIL